jgi:hypothetical protein
MNTVTRSLLGVALTAGAMYMLDPVSGHERRLLLRDRCARTARRLELGTRDARHEISHQVHDIASKARTQLGRGKVSDKALLKHTRAAINRASSHPEAITCTVQDGHAYLRGDVLTYEHQHLLDELRSVEGIRVITDHLTIREPHEGVRQLHDSNGHGWSLAGRVFAGATGCALVFWGIKERKALGEFGAAAWKLTRKELEEKADEIRHAIESGIEEARSTPIEAIESSREVVEDIHARVREGDAGSGARSGFVM